MITKKEQNIFTFVHPKTKDTFVYDNENHFYSLNGTQLPGTTTPMTLVNELSWNRKGVMSDKTQIIKNWALKVMYEKALELWGEKDSIFKDEFVELVSEAKKAPNQRFKDAGLSGTQIHEIIEELIKSWITSNKGYPYKDLKSLYPQVQNFIDWALKRKVRFLFSEEPLYSKEWMNCGTVDFICEIDGKILIGDIKTNGDKRRYDGEMVKGKWVEDRNMPLSDIHIVALWQTGAYGKMSIEEDARKLIENFEGVVVVNIKKSGEFDERLDVRFDYDVKSLIEAYDHVIKLYKLFRSKL